MTINKLLSLLAAMALIVGISGCATTSTDGKNQPRAYEHGHKGKQHYARSNHNQHHCKHRVRHHRSMGYSWDSNQDWIVDEEELEEGLAKIADARETRMREHIQKRNERILKYHDTDKDGKLNAAEREAAKKQWQERRKGRAKTHEQWRRHHKEGSHRKKRNHSSYWRGHGTRSRGKSHWGHTISFVMGIDKDHDGIIDDTEFDAAFVNLEELMKKHKEHFFKRIDTDGDGALSMDERKASHIAGKDKWESKRKTMRDYWAKRLDGNKDGEITSKEIDDFYHARKDSFKKSLKTMVAMRNDYRVKKYDSNKDGSLSKDERGKAMSRWREKMKAHWQKHRKSQDED